MQAARAIEVSSPLGQDVLLFHRMTVTERLGRLFEIQLDVLSEDADINIPDVLAQPMTIRVDLPEEGEARHFNGFVSEFSYIGTTGRYATYTATLRPWLWFLTRTANCRIFQEKTVPDIVKEIFRDHGFTDFEESLSGSYRTWEYCVQYRETDFNFVSRLMEQEGLYYYFKHEDGKHTLVFADGSGSHEANPGYESVPYFPPDEMDRRERDHVYDIRISQEVQPGKYSLNDFDFERPKAALETTSVVSRQHDKADYEVYDSPGEYTDAGDGDTYARVRIEEIQAQYETLHGQGTVRGLSAGCLFELTGCPRSTEDREYLVVSAIHELQSNPYESDSSAPEADYSCSFSAIDSRQPYRAPRSTPKPVVQGPQTAVVTGPSGDEIWPDQFGRVKVKFHWDRAEAEDETSSCWIRVSQPWAGKNWGGMFLPHVGHEVIVEFLEGDPDRPIITGRVYNGDNMPPEDLPGAATKSIIRDHGGNEIVMEGADGSQFIHWKQACGNEILMNGASGAEGIELRDKYGNEIVMDAVAGTIRLESPSHNTKMVLGESWKCETDSDQKWIVKGHNHEFYIGGQTRQFLGGKSDVYVGLQQKLTVSGAWDKHVGYVMKNMLSWQHTIGYGWEKKKNYADKDNKSDGHYYFDSEKYIHLIGGPSDNGQLLLDDDEATISSNGGEVFITLHKGGNIQLHSPEDLIVQAKNISLRADDRIDLKCTKYHIDGEEDQGNIQAKKG